jgi:hypothetical protein
MAGQDPWEKAQMMAAQIGCELFFDQEGICVLQNLSNTNPVSMYYVEGPDNILLYANKRYQDENTYNHVVFTGEAASGATVPYRGEAMDLNLTSPTYIYGDYGQVTYFETSPLITSNAQAEDAARLKLGKVLGLTELMEIQAICNPAHDVGDVIKVTRAKSKIDADYIIDKLSIPLTPDRPLAGSCRARYVV